MPLVNPCSRYTLTHAPLARHPAAGSAADPDVLAAVADYCAHESAAADHVGHHDPPHGHAPAADVAIMTGDDGAPSMPTPIADHGPGMAKCCGVARHHGA